MDELACCLACYAFTIIQFHIFISAEILHYTGISDDIPEFSDEQKNLFGVMRTRVTKVAGDFGNQVKTVVNPNNIQAFVDDERMAALGLAGGALVGMVL